MFIFRFKFQGYIKDYLIKKQKRGSILAALITALLFFIPAVIIGVMWYNNFIAVMISIGLTAFSFLFLICFSRWDSPLNGFYKSIPENIIIDSKQSIIETSGITEYCYKSVNFDEIKEILDLETFYEIKFYGHAGSMFFICQKDLIVEGTIEEFEQLFEDKIVRKCETKD